MNCYRAKILAHTIRGFRRSVAKLINAPAFMRPPLHNSPGFIPLHYILHSLQRHSVHSLPICLPTHTCISAGTAQEDGMKEIPMQYLQRKYLRRNPVCRNGI
jgi:hypothetical protein